MFSCFLRARRGSGLKKDNTEGLGGIWRHRVHSCLQRLWPFSRKGKILTKGSQDRVCRDQGEKASAQLDLQEAYRESNISTDTVVNWVNNLVPSLQEGDQFFVPGFLPKYQRFAITLQVLDLLFMRYATFGPYSEEDEQVKNTLCSFLDTWMDKNPEDFCETLDLLVLKYIKDSYSVYLAHSDLSVRDNRIQTMLQEKKAKNSQSEDDKDSDVWEHTSSDPEIQWV